MDGPDVVDALQAEWESFEKLINETTKEEGSVKPDSTSLPQSGPVPAPKLPSSPLAEIPLPSMQPVSKRRDSSSDSDTDKDDDDAEQNGKPPKKKARVGSSSESESSTESESSEEEEEEEEEESSSSEEEEESSSEESSESEEEVKKKKSKKSKRKKKSKSIFLIGLYWGCLQIYLGHRQPHDRYSMYPSFYLNGLPFRHITKFDLKVSYPTCSSSMLTASHE